MFSCLMLCLTLHDTMRGSKHHNTNALNHERKLRIIEACICVHAIVQIYKNKDLKF